MTDAPPVTIAAEVRRHVEQRPEPTTFDTLDDAAVAHAMLRDQFGFVCEQLRDIKTALDIILKTLKVDEEADDGR